MQAIILAGGFGTRLQSVVSDVPKPMAPVCEKPFLTYLLDDLALSNFNKVVLAVGYKKECIIDYFHNSYKGMEIVYSIEESPLGTGGCVKQAFQYIDEEYAFVLNGDTMFKIDYLAMAKMNSLSIACKKMENFNRYGEVKINDGIVSFFEEKKQVSIGYINGGIYYIPKKIFNKYPLATSFSMENDFFAPYLNELKIKAFMSDGYFIDIGIPSDYNKAQKDFLKNKALFLDRDGIINIDYGHVHSIDQFKLTDFIIPLCQKYQNLGYKIIVITNQAGIAKGIYSEKEFIILNNYMLNLFKNEGIVISDVYYCPHKTEDNCECRKPKPGLFNRAIQEHNIDASVSIAIGDKMSDLEAAHSAGIKELLFKKTDYEEYKVDFKYTRMD